MGKVIKITKEQINQIIDMYLSGETKVDIAKNLNISTQSVTKYLLKNNIKQRQHFLTDDIKKQICKLYTENKNTIKDISQKLNVHSDSIKRTLRDNGIEQRDLSDVLRKYKLNKEYFDCVNNQNKSYILGFFIC